MSKANVRVWIRPGSFGKFPLDLDTSTGNSMKNTFATPIMCIGAGTGIAPLRSLIHEREAVRQISMYNSNNNSDEDDGVASKPTTENSDDCTMQLRTIDSILVFGCRKEGEDYYYKDEWMSLSTTTTAKTGSGEERNNTKFPSLRVLNAFSQDQKNKIYVQRVMREADEGLLVARHVLEDGGAVYVAGGAKMAKAVKDEINDCLAQHLPNGSADVKRLLQRLQRTGRFNIEAWS